jgi:hypothetical protein
MVMGVPNGIMPLGSILIPAVSGMDSTTEIIIALKQDLVLGTSLLNEGNIFLIMIKTPSNLA